eukprot:753161-Pelagomonas_calceolata.AAC.1
MMCKVALLFLFEFLKLRVLSLVVLLVCWAAAASRVGKGLVSSLLAFFLLPFPSLCGLEFFLAKALMRHSHVLGRCNNNNNNNVRTFLARLQTV